MTEKIENVLGHGQGGSVLVHIGPINEDMEGTTSIVQKYKELMGKFKKIRVEQIMFSGILPVMSGRGATYINCERITINALVE